TPAPRAADRDPRRRCCCRVAPGFACRSFSSSALSLFVVSFRGSQALPNEIDFLSRRRNTALRLLLERVKNIDRISRPPCVHHAVCLGIVAVPDLHHACPLEALERLRRRVRFALLRRIERMPDRSANGVRKRLQVRPARPHPNDRLRTRLMCHTSIRILV